MRRDALKRAVAGVIERMLARTDQRFALELEHLAMIAIALGNGLAAAGAKADGEVGDGDPMRAVEAVLSRRQFDEIIVSTLPERLSHWLRQDFPSRLEHRFRLPVTHVEATALPSL